VSLTNTDYITQEEIHSLAVKKGWWDEWPDREKKIPEALMLIVSEAAEALEEYRNHHKPTEVYFESDGNGQQKPQGFAIELADIVIRCRDNAEAYGINLEEMVYLKHKYNMTRPVRHGGKRA
jgi:hypothetical protein